MKMMSKEYLKALSLAEVFFGWGLKKFLRSSLIMKFK